MALDEQVGGRSKKGTNWAKPVLAGLLLAALVLLIMQYLSA